MGWSTHRPTSRSRRSAAGRRSGCPRSSASPCWPAARHSSRRARSGSSRRSPSRPALVAVTRNRSVVAEIGGDDGVFRLCSARDRRAVRGIRVTAEPGVGVARGAGPRTPVTRQRLADERSSRDARFLRVHRHGLMPGRTAGDEHQGENRSRARDDAVPRQTSGTHRDEHHPPGCDPDHPIRMKARYSYCSASSMLSLPARRAGKIAATRPAMIAAMTNTTSVPHGIVNAG